MLMHAKLNAQLHRVAGEFAGESSRAHEVAKLFAREELGVESIAALTNAQAKELIRIIRAARNDAQWNVRIATGDDTDEPMSDRQRSYLADLKKKLNWSDEYCNMLIVNRWGQYLHESQRALAALPRWAAVRLISLMIARVTSKHHYHHTSDISSSGGNDEIQSRHRHHAQRDTSISPNHHNRSADAGG